MAYLYFCLLLGDAALHRWANRLPFPQEIKDLMTSWGAFDYRGDPRYRPWLKGFVLEPNKLWTYSFRGDTFKVLDVPEPEPLKFFSLPVDRLGFVNDKSIFEADVLFIGDSFARSVGCRFEETIPVIFENLSGRKVYNASFPGYGLPHYLELLRRFTVQYPSENERFHGRDVYVLCYIGNDLLSNINDFKRRSADELAPRWPHHLRLRTIRHFKYLAHVKMKAMLERRRRSAETQEGLPDLVRTKGYYPVSLDIPSYRDTAFAFDPYIAKYKNLDWLDEERRRYIIDIMQDFRLIAKENRLTVRFVLLPVNIQVLGPYIETPSRHAVSSLQFHDVYPSAWKNFDLMAAFLEEEIHAAGFDVIDMKAHLQREIVDQPLYWPGDTHLTPAGNKLVAKRIWSDY